MASANFTIPQEELQELAEFWTDKGDALSLYFQPPVPSELSHREEPILAKQNIQQRLASLQGTSPADRADIHRILESISGMQGNQGKSKLIFACASRDMWREYDIPGDFGVFAQAENAFTIAPLVAQQEKRRRYCIALADRNRGRLLLLEARQISEHSQVLDEEKEKIRTTGTSKSVHLERKKEEQARLHFSFIADHLLHFHEHGDFDSLLIGCRDEMWPEIEATLHPDLQRVLVGHFRIDPGLATAEEIQEKAQAFIDEKDRREEQELVQTVMGAAASDGLGAVGLEAVIGALERGEVRALLWPRSRTAGAPPQPGGSGTTNSSRSVSLCPNCGHVDSAPTQECTLCGQQMRRFARAEEALLRHALGRSIELRMLTYAKLPPPDEIVAWLRFLARRNTAQALAS